MQAQESQCEQDRKSLCLGRANQTSESTLVREAATVVDADDEPTRPGVAQRPKKPSVVGMTSPARGKRNEQLEDPLGDVVRDVVDEGQSRSHEDGTQRQAGRSSRDAPMPAASLHDHRGGEEQERHQAGEMARPGRPSPRGVAEARREVDVAR